MSNRLAILAVLFAGCSGEQQDLRPFVAVAGKYSLMAAASQPAVPDDRKCKSCRGRGEVGDGRTMMKCSRCNGTGVEPQADQPATVEAPALAPAPPVKCKDGKCPTPSIVR